MAGKKHHVLRNPSGGWSVKKEGSARASGKFATQKEAIEAAKAISQKQGTRVVVHDRNGRITKR
ncbi:DUF2188 domain-containing protein [Salinisphaera sp. RV14]|uniref:DUF2188 domain-containing protein n=1 Tax=Salinisphaera sp. RV14 TaxID=3454140 RepID=UPI003F8598F3